MARPPALPEESEAVQVSSPGLWRYRAGGSGTFLAAGSFPDATVPKTLIWHRFNMIDLMSKRVPKCSTWHSLVAMFVCLNG